MFRVICQAADTSGGAAAVTIIPTAAAASGGEIFSTEDCMPMLRRCVVRGACQWRNATRRGPRERSASSKICICAMCMYV